MSPKDVLELIYQELQQRYPSIRNKKYKGKHPGKRVFDSNVRLYESTDLVNDLYLKIYDTCATLTEENVLECIRSSVTPLEVKGYRNKRNPLLFTEEFTNKAQKEYPNHELEAIIIEQTKDRLSQLINLSSL